MDIWVCLYNLKFPEDERTFPCAVRQAYKTEKEARDWIKYISNKYHSDESAYYVDKVTIND